MMKKKAARRGLEALRSLRPCHSKGLDDLCRKLTSLTARKRGFEVQLKSCEDRTNSLKEILQKIREEETELTNLLKSNIKLPSNDGGDRRQPSLPETVGHMGKEMVFRF
ncbi:MAG: hypothetical protein HZA70_02755 [Planctomycetes bacterium]|nr:hypothetical protein [Planctomycetota bacterium]